MKGSGFTRLIVAVVLAVIGLGTIGLISFQIQVGNITIILGDKNKVENGDQSQTVIQPVKPTAVEAQPEKPVNEPASVAPYVPVQTATPPIRASLEAPRAIRRYPVRQYQPEDECESVDDDSESQHAQPIPSWVKVEPQRTLGRSSASAIATADDGYEVEVGDGSVRRHRSVSTSTTTVNGQVTRRRVIVNGRVVVDE